MTNRDILDAMHNPALQENGYNDVVTQVDFRLSDHPNPRKARKKNINAAMKALKPDKRFILSPKRWFRGKFRHTKPHECVICGIECMNADYGDLFDEYFRDPVSLQISPFTPTAGVLPGRGRDLKGTYCPQHMMLYHNLMEWIEQEEEEDPGFFTKMAKKGVAFVPIIRQPPAQEHPLIVKWTPIFQEALKDGIQLVHYKNPITQENDITMLVFDNRVLAQTAPRHNTMSSMDMSEYYKVMEQMQSTR
mgnify:FL=1|tara:strand:- start:634 stop:1377 length:744 start_codon:yes stop_codon:yes gene_type:complete